MSYVQIVGGGLVFPKIPPLGLPLSLGTTLLIDATGEQLALSGRVWFKERTGTKNISRVCFRFGAVTKSSGSGLTVSLQDTSLTAGPPAQPDGTQDQTVAIANGNASFASNTWIRTGTLGSSRTVSFGDRISIVVEYDGSGRLGSDSVIVNFANALVNGAQYGGATTALNAGGWVAANSGIPNVILEFDDGTFGTLDGSFPFSATNTHTYNSGTGTADEYAAVIQFPFACKVDGLWAGIALTGDCELLLYSGTTALATVGLDANAINSSSVRYFLEPIAEQILAANTPYYVAVRPTTATNISAYSFDVADANHLSVHDGGVNCNYATRLDQGSWAAATTTRRLLAGVRISQIDVGGGGVNPLIGLLG